MRGPLLDRAGAALDSQDTAAAPVAVERHRQAAPPPAERHRGRIRMEKNRPAVGFPFQTEARTSLQAVPSPVRRPYWTEALGVLENRRALYFQVAVFQEPEIVDP